MSNHTKAAATGQTATTVTKRTGGTTRMTANLSGEPDRLTTATTLARLAEGTPLNGVELADQMSAALAHERQGAHAYRALAAMSTHPQAIEAFEQLSEESARAASRYADAIGEAGGSPTYVSPLARATAAVDSHQLGGLMTAGSLGPLSLDAVAAQIGYQAACACVLHNEGLSRAARAAGDTPLGRALGAATSELRPIQEQHVKITFDLACQLAAAASAGWSAQPSEERR